MPGPLHAKLTGLALKVHDIRGTRYYYVLGLHERYGSTVRIAPNEVAISDPKVVRRVHGFGTEFRKQQQPGTAFNIFSLSDPKIHRERQRFYNQVFSQESLKEHNEPAMRELSITACEGMKKDARLNQHLAADMFKWCMLFGYDAAFQIIYGHTEGLMSQNKGVEEVIMGCYLQRLNSWMLFSFPLFLLGRWFSPLSATLRDIFRVEWRYKDIFEAGDRQREIASKTVFVKNSRYEKKGDTFGVSQNVRLNDVDIAHDITTFLGAGGEAVGATLVYLLWSVLKQPQLQKRLEAEVAGLSGPPTNALCENLPVLNGVIYESLRLYGGGATHLPRYAPNPTNLGGYIIPPLTAVTSHGPALHRNPDVWGEDANEYVMSRSRAEFS